MMTELEEKVLKFYLGRVGVIVADGDSLRPGIGSVISTLTLKRSTRTRWTERKPLLRDTGKHVWTSGCRCRTSWRFQKQHLVALVLRESGEASLFMRCQGCSVYSGSLNPS